MTVSRAGWLLALLAAPILAGGAGPPAPGVAKDTPAERAIALYAAEHGRRAPPKPCRQTRGEDIVVCGRADGTSPYRMPLADERGPRDGPKTATGELPAGGAGGSPMQRPPGVGLTLTLKRGQGAKVAGNGN